MLLCCLFVPFVVIVVVVVVAAVVFRVKVELKIFRRTSKMRAAVVESKQSRNR